MMSAEERVRILREARPSSWLAFSNDESKLLACSDSYVEVVKAAERLGETEPVIVKTPDNWDARIFLFQ